MSYKPGQCGNPNGRPRKGKTLTEALEKYANKRVGGVSNRDALAKTLFDLALVNKDVAAIKYVYDRIDGRPRETIAADVKGNIISIGLPPGLEDIDPRV
ncbi:hypothetical protein FACS189450_10230 [Spirochaetia bacterium]|nr:hypothetical protein FACS189450_10230 [Spirochaetia bacterium]